MRVSVFVLMLIAPGLSLGSGVNYMKPQPYSPPTYENNPSKIDYGQMLEAYKTGRAIRAMIDEKRTRELRRRVHAAIGPCAEVREDILAGDDIALQACLTLLLK